MRMVGVRIPLSTDMEENYRIIPEFWKSVLSSNLFSEICVLSNQSPKGILGVSVYESPQRIFYYIAVATDAPVPPDMFEFEIPAATWVVFEIMVFSKRMCRVFSKDFIQSGYLFRAMNTQNFQI